MMSMHSKRLKRLAVVGLMLTPLTASADLTMIWTTDGSDAYALYYADADNWRIGSPPSDTPGHASGHRGEVSGGLENVKMWLLKRDGNVFLVGENDGQPPQYTRGEDMLEAMDAAHEFLGMSRDSEPQPQDVEIRKTGRQAVMAGIRGDVLELAARYRSGRIERVEVLTSDRDDIREAVATMRGVSREAGRYWLGFADILELGGAGTRLDQEYGRAPIGVLNGSLQLSYYDTDELAPHLLRLPSGAVETNILTSRVAGSWAPATARSVPGASRQGPVDSDHDGVFEDPHGHEARPVFEAVEEQVDAEEVGRAVRGLIRGFIGN